MAISSHLLAGGSRWHHSVPLISSQAVVGVITPYRSQRDLIKETFRRLLGSQAADKVKMEPVDRLQARGLTLASLTYRVMHCWVFAFLAFLFCAFPFVIVPFFLYVAGDPTVVRHFILRRLQRGVSALRGTTGPAPPSVPAP